MMTKMFVTKSVNVKERFLVTFETFIVSFCIGTNCSNGKFDSFWYYLRHEQDIL